MSHPFDRDDQATKRKQRQRDQQAQQQFRADVRQVLGHEAGRRVLWAFLQAANIDGTPFNTNAMAQSHGIGWQDAGRWWLAAMREHCPERENQMRAEANKALKHEGETEDESDDD